MSGTNLTVDHAVFRAVAWAVDRAVIAAHELPGATPYSASCKGFHTTLGFRPATSWPRITCPTPPVKAILQKLGPQDHCWTGGSENRRFYVWKIEELWVLVNNTKGIFIEVPVEKTPERAHELWSIFYSKVVKP